MANRKRNIQMKFWVTEEEKRLIDEKMKLLPTQFHDVLPGSSIDPVYDDTRKLYAEIFDFAGKKERELVNTVFSPKENGDAVTVGASYSCSSYRSRRSSYRRLLR